MSLPLDAPQGIGELGPGVRGAYLWAGRAKVTVQSLKTGRRFTFKVRRAKPREGMAASYFVDVLAEGWVYLGVWRTGRLFGGPKAGGATTALLEAQEAAEWWLGRPESDKVRVWHEGTCGRCGRSLTDPQSIARGLGPECADAELA